MLEASQKEVRNFAKLLRKKLKDGGCHQAYVNSLSDQQLLDDFRTCCDCGEELHSRGQQLRLILESDTAERAFELLYPSYEGGSPEIGEDDLPFEDSVDDYEEIEEIEEISIRGKWMFDGAETIDEMIHQLDQFKEYLLSLKNDNFELTGPIEDDYGFLQRKE